MAKTIAIKMVPKFREATEKQQEFGIGLNVDIQLQREDGVVLLSLRDAAMRWNSKDSRWFFSPPARKGTNKHNETAWYDYYRLYPEDRELSDELSGKLIAAAIKQGIKLPEGGIKPKSRNNNGNTAKASTKDSDPFEEDDLI